MGHGKTSWSSYFFISTIPASGVDLIITILCKISITVSASLMLLGFCLVLVVKMMDVMG